MTQKFILNKNDGNRKTILANLVSFLQKLPEAKSWKITIEAHKKNRTNAQNHALFGVAYPVLAEQTGFSVDELHEAFCRKFFGTVGVSIAGQTLLRPFRTTTRDENGRRDVMETKQFSEFYAMVQQIGAEAGLYVPDPDPLWYLS